MTEIINALSEPVRPIRYVKVSNEFEGNEGDGWAVGYSGVTEIEMVLRAGLHSDIPYVRVWKGKFMFAEYCLHNIVGVEYLDTRTT